MDVRCDRCETEYDLDDALISQRGTSVQCTNCGHRFRVFPTVAHGSPELWSVRTASGRQHVFTSLKELQLAIAERRVGRADLLSRGDEPPRPLGVLAELQTFFPEQPAAEDKLLRTLHGVAPAPEPLPEASVPLPEAPARLPEAPPAEPAPRVRRGTRPLGSEATEPAPDARPAAPDPAPASEPLAAGAPIADGDRASSPSVAPEPAPERLSTPVSEPEPVRSSPAPETSLARSEPQDSISDEDELPVESRYSPQHRARGRWIAGLVLLAVAVLISGTVGRKYVARFAKVARQRSETGDRRQSELVERGRRELDDGNFEAASRTLLEARAANGRDSALLGELARLETVRADLDWLRLRLLDPARAAERATAERALSEQVQRATRAVKDAVQAGADGRALARHRVDVARIQGELGRARRLVGPVAAGAHLPENAYVLAALDLADPAPVWISVLERLRLSAARAREGGRARVALVYALVKAGQPEQALLELEKWRNRKPLPALWPELTEFVRRETAALREQAASDAGADAGAAPTAPASTAAFAIAPATPVDFRAQLREASAALSRRELARAEQLFRAVLATRAESAEALTGLGDVAARRGDGARAAELYERVLAKNPRYVPALLARADQRWASDRAGAIALYRRVVQEAGPSSSYGRRALQRIEQAERAEAPAAAASDSPADAAGSDGATE